MRATYTFDHRRLSRELRALMRIAGPLIANNLALAGMSLTDTVMAGKISATDLAAVGVGNAYWMVLFLFGLGVLMAMSPITAQSLGAGREREVGAYARQSLYISQLVGLLAIVLLLNAGPIFAAIGISAEFRPLAAGYAGALSFGAPAIFAYLVLRFASEGLAHTRPIALVAGFALVFNAVADYVLMYGKLGFPAMGAVGCGYATAFTQWAMLAVMIWYVTRGHRAIYLKLGLFERFDWPSPVHVREILALGLPIGVGILAEVGLFSAAAMIIGRLGAAAAGAHQIAINYAATMFMVPLGIHSATIARVGHHIGQGDPAAARFAGFTGVGACTLFMSLSAVVMLVFRGPVIGLYTNDDAVREIAYGLLLMAAAFQVSDGIQVGAMGALRGFRDTTIPMVFSVFAYWVIGFSLAWYAVVVRGLGPVWVWGGLAAGLSVAAVLLTLRFAIISRVGDR